MCPAHWAMVPKQLQQAVNVAWDHGEGAGTTAHNTAIHRAIEAVNAKLGD